MNMYILCLCVGLVLLLTLLPTSQSQATPSTRNRCDSGHFIVSLNKSSCYEKKISCCNTLKEWRKKVSVFSTPNSTWTFLRGDHYLPGDIQIKETTNIIWTGEDACKSVSVSCTIVLATTREEQDRSASSTLFCMSALKFTNVTGVSIKNLVFKNEANYPVKHRKNSKYSSNSTCVCKLYAKNVTNMTIDRVDYSFSQSLQQRSDCITLIDPLGTYIITSSVIKLPRVVIANECSRRSCRSCGNRPSCDSAGNFSLTLKHTFLLFGEFTVDLSGFDGKQYENIKISMQHCQLRALVSIGQYTSNNCLRTFKEPKFRVTVRGSNAEVTITDNIMQGNPSAEMVFELPIVFNYTGTNCNLTTVEVLTTPLNNFLHIADNCFGRLKSFKLKVYINQLLTIPVVGRAECTSRHQRFFLGYPTVDIRNTIMSLSKGFTASVENISKCLEENLEWQTPPIILNITNTTFWRTQYYSIYPEPLVTFKGFRLFRVKLANTTIYSELTQSTIAMLLSNSDVQMHEYNAIQISNNYTQMSLSSKEMRQSPDLSEAIVLFPDSRILLARSSQLSLKVNINCTSIGETTFNSFFSAVRVAIGRQSYNDYVKNMIVFDERLDRWVPRQCFFQFIHDNGSYISDAETEQPNASIDIQYENVNCTVEKSPFLYVVNGHFQNCSLMTGSQNYSTYQVTENILQHMFNNSNITSEMNVVYKISVHYVNSDFHTTPPLSIYYGQQVEVSIYLEGDFQCKVTEYTNIIVSYSSSKVTNQYRASSMTRIPLLINNHLRANQTHTITIQASNDLFMDYTLTKDILVHVKPCPIGMTEVNTSASSSGCQCIKELTNLKFDCSTDKTVSYRNTKEMAWIGNPGGKLTVSRSCPQYFCKEDLHRTGLSDDKIFNSSEQCLNGREGLSCGQCTSDLSSVLGSYTCSNCTWSNLAALPAFALAGILLIGVLFLFNLTVLQGTINSIVLYVNILSFMSDFIDEYSITMLQFPLKLINLNLGFGLCLYGNMDEFAKAFLLFAFPTYLFVILIFIVIIASKCNPRICRVRFIANRSVPVLGTILLLTYTGLSSAVIYTLRYANIYEVYGDQRKVWFYQPQLNYFEGRHLALAFIALLVSAFCILPFTILMLFGDLLRRHIHKLWFTHFLDVLYGAYKWPFGVIFGLRLLVRLLIMGISLAESNSDNSKIKYAISIATIIAALHVVQVIVKPFKSTEQHERYLPRNLVRSVRLGRCSCITKVIQPATLDHLFGGNIICLGVLMAVSYESPNHNDWRQVLTFATNLMLALANFLILVVFIYHGYKFFPVPAKWSSRMKRLASTTQDKLNKVKVLIAKKRQAEEILADDANNTSLRGPLVDIRALVPESGSEDEDEDDASSEEEHGMEHDNRQRLLPVL